MRLRLRVVASISLAAVGLASSVTPAPVSGQGEAEGASRGPGFTFAVRGALGIRPGLDLGAVRTDPDVTGFDFAIAPSTAAGPVFSFGLELGPSRWPLTFETFFERSEHNATIPPLATEGNRTSRVRGRTARVKMTSVTGSVRLVSPFARGPVKPYVALGGGWEETNVRPTNFCDDLLRCEDFERVIVGDFSYAVFRVALGADVRFGPYAVYFEAADALGTIEFPLGDLPQPEFVSIPGRNHALSFTVGLRANLVGPDQ